MIFLIKYLKIAEALTDTLMSLCQGSLSELKKEMQSTEEELKTVCHTQGEPEALEKRLNQVKVSSVWIVCHFNIISFGNESTESVLVAVVLKPSSASDSSSGVSDQQSVGSNPSLGFMCMLIYWLT